MRSTACAVPAQYGTSDGDNPLLLRLKELEALEKLVEKVGRIDLHAGAGVGGFDALLHNLYSLRERADAAKPA